MMMENAESNQVFSDTISLRYDYSLGEVAGKFMDGLKQGKILATRCSKSGLTYLPPRSFCELSFERCDSWVEVGLTGVIEQSTIVVRGYEGKRKAPQAVAFVRLDGSDSAIANYVDGLDFNNLKAAMAQIAPGTRVKVIFSSERQGRITDFSFALLEG
ncbi:MAG: DNA-binding protein [Hyphomicrobiales bacterium]|nr:MAG: DNA-binding protein [Hyphomicrobiales bacterium]